MTEVHNLRFIEQHELEPGPPKLTAIDGGLNDYRPYISIDTLSDRWTNPIGKEIHNAIYLENQKNFFGYDIAGTAVPPSRESRLRGMRNILSDYPQYQKYANVGAGNLINAINSLEKTKKTKNGKSISIYEVVQNDINNIFEMDNIFIKLVSGNDPLIVVLAQLHQQAPEAKYFNQFFNDSLIVFQFENLNTLSEAQIKKIRKSLGKPFIIKNSDTIDE